MHQFFSFNRTGALRRATLSRKALASCGWAPTTRRTRSWEQHEAWNSGWAVTTGLGSIIWAAGAQARARCDLTMPDAEAPRYYQDSDFRAYRLGACYPDPSTASGLTKRRDANGREVTCKIKNHPKNTNTHQKTPPPTPPTKKQQTNKK